MYFFSISEPEVIVISSDDHGESEGDELVKRKVTKRTFEFTIQIEDIFKKKKKKRKLEWNKTVFLLSKNPTKLIVQIERWFCVGFRKVDHRFREIGIEKGQIISKIEESHFIDQ